MLVRLVALLLTALTLAGCAVQRTVDSQVQSWSTLARLPQPPSYRLDLLPSQQQERSFDAIVPMAHTALARAGLQRDDAAPRLIAEIGVRTGVAYADAIDLSVLFAAAACDSFYCPPAAYVQVLGLDRAVPHVKTALAKLGIEPQLSVIRDYKSAAQLVTRTDLTPEARRNAEALLGDRYAVMRAAIAAGRRVDEDTVEGWLEQALFTAPEARAAGLVDGLLYWDELTPRFTADAKKGPRLVTLARYADEDPDDLDLGGRKKIAVIHAQGNIGGRENGINPLLGLMMGHESITRELERARRDEDVVAIVLRVDSGGGESLASDLMGHKVEQVAREKPVVVSMVDVAASGGYMMSYRASRILADPLTVTGSIGSISGKFDMSGFNAKIGLNYSHVSVGPNATFLDDNRPFTPDEFARFDANHQADFQLWIEGVARARGLSVADVEGLAMGRVFSGGQAVANGLVDELGGLPEAVAAARRLAGVAEKERTGLWHLPEKQGLLGSLLGGDEEVGAAARWMLYRAVRQDLRQVRESLAGPTWHAIDPVYVDQP